MRRCYRYNEETKQMEEIPSRKDGVVYGKDLLEKFRREGLCPVDDFKDTWEKAETERKRLRGELPPTKEMREERRRALVESYERVRSGYRPNRRPMLED